MDKVSRIQYSINAGVNNLYQAFCGQPYNLAVQLSKLRTSVVNVLADSTFKLVSSYHNILRRAVEIRRSNINVDGPLGTAILAAIRGGRDCVEVLGLSVTDALLLKTASVAAAAQKVSSIVS